MQTSLQAAFHLNNERKIIQIKHELKIPAGYFQRWPRSWIRGHREQLALQQMARAGHELDGSGLQVTRQRRLQ